MNNTAAFYELYGLFATFPCRNSAVRRVCRKPSVAVLTRAEQCKMGFTVSIVDLSCCS